MSRKEELKPLGFGGWLGGIGCCSSLQISSKPRDAKHYADIYIYTYVYIQLHIHIFAYTYHVHVYVIPCVHLGTGEIWEGPGWVWKWKCFFCPVYGNFSRGKMSESGDFTIKCIHMIHMYSNVGVTFFRTNPLKMNRK